MRLTNQISDQNGVVRTEQYGYDPLYRLTSVDYGDGGTQSYSFDTMGNRLTKVNNGTSESYTYNNANMLLTRGSNNYTNDANGNTLTGGGRTNIWDSQNRLTQVTNGSTVSQHTYGSDGLRRRMTVGSNITDYGYDATMTVREWLNGAVNATYFQGASGPIYKRDASGNVKWYCYDGLGSVLGEVDPSGTLTRTQTYDVYGLVRTSAGTATTKHKFVGQLGHPSDDETGLIYMRARHYDPVVGRFVSEDPARDGVNWFSYCGGDPVNKVDVDGRKPIDWLSGIGFALGFALCGLAVLEAVMGNPIWALKIAATAMLSIAIAGCGMQTREQDIATVLLSAAVGASINKEMMALEKMLAAASAGSKVPYPGVPKAIMKVFALGVAQLAFCILTNPDFGANF